MPEEEQQPPTQWSLTIVTVAGGVREKAYVVAENIDELVPKTVTIEGVKYIRYSGNGGNYAEFLPSTIVARYLDQEIIKEDQSS